MSSRSLPFSPNVAREIARVAEPPVVNASPLIILAQAGHLNLLRVVGEPVRVPRPVEREVLRPGISDAASKAIQSQPWLEIVDPGPIPAAVRQYNLVDHLLHATDWRISASVIVRVLASIGE